MHRYYLAVKGSPMAYSWYDENGLDHGRRDAETWRRAGSPMHLWDARTGEQVG